MNPFIRVSCGGHIIVGPSELTDNPLITRLLSLQLPFFDLRRGILFAFVLICFLVCLSHACLLQAKSITSVLPSSFAISPPPPCPTAACPTAHRNDNSIDVKCVAFGPLEHITLACLAQPPPHFKALLWCLLCPPLLGWADNNLENSLYM